VIEIKIEFLFAIYEKAYINMTTSLTEEQRLYIREQFELTEKKIELHLSKNKKKKKDPLAPKRPGTAFTMFSSDNREGLKETEPDLSFGETAKKLGEMWRAVDDNTRAKYEKKCIKEKEKHRVALEAYNRQSLPEVKEEV
jgi:hypothetical protein